MQFDEAVQYLLSLGHETLAMKLGLANVARLLDALDNPQRAYPAVQLAGTNGKGSTAALLDAVCRAAHLRTGLYTSPHLSAITERIKLSGHDIVPAEFAQHATRVRAAAEQLHAATGARPTFFEQVTAIALLAFRTARVQLAILETGLGGRLEATAAGRFVATFRTHADEYEGVRLSLRGRHQLTNAATAIALAEELRAQGYRISRAAIIAGLQTAKHPGRLELLPGPPPLLLDGAHNPAGAESLRAYL